MNARAPRKLSDIPQTLHEAIVLLGNRDRRKVCNNTTLERTRAKIGPYIYDGIALTHHSTDIVVYLPGDRYIVRNDGWYTPSTKKRISLALPPSFYIRGNNKNEEWSISHMIEGGHGRLTLGEMNPRGTLINTQTLELSDLTPFDTHNFTTADP